jgi:hypothetical protein
MRLHFLLDFALTDAGSPLIFTRLDEGRVTENSTKQLTIAVSKKNHFLFTLHKLKGCSCSKWFVCCFFIVVDVGLVDDDAEKLWSFRLTAQRGLHLNGMGPCEMG